MCHATMTTNVRVVVHGVELRMRWSGKVVLCGLVPRPHVKMKEGSRHQAGMEVSLWSLHCVGQYVSLCHCTSLPVHRLLLFLPLGQPANVLVIFSSHCPLVALFSSD